MTTASPRGGAPSRKGIASAWTRSLCATALLLLTLPILAAPPAVCVLSGTVLNGGGAPIVNAQVRARVIQPVLVSGAGIAAQDLTTKTAADGTWSLTLIQGLNAQIDIPAISIAKDFVVPSTSTALYSDLTLYNRGSLTPATILSDHGPSMGGDLTGSSPNPSVVGLRSQTLYAEACMDGQVRVFRSASGTYRCEAVSAAGAVQSVTAGTGIAVSGTATAPVVGISPAGVTSSLLGTGAAASNLGAAAGDLSGTYPGPSIAAGAVTNAKVSNSAAIAWSKIDKTGATAADVGALSTASGLTGVSAGTGITVSGSAPSPTVGITPGGVTVTQLGTGAAAANVGTLSGVLAGTLPAPTFAAGAIQNADVNAGAAIAWTKISKSGAVAADIGAEASANKGQPNGYASLGGDGKVPSGQLPTGLTPAAHAASHASAGSDPVSPASIGAAATSHTHAEGDITSLVADLASKGGKTTPNTWTQLQTFTGGISVSGPQTFTGDVLAPVSQALGVTMTVPTGLSASAVLDGALAPGTYYYRVTALDGGGGETTGSGEQSAAVGGLNASVSLSWTAVPGAASYRVYRGTAAGLEDTYYTALSNSYTDDGSAGTGGTVPGTNTARAVELRQGTSWVLGGNVGIGKAAPSTALDVAGTVTATAFAGNLTGNVTGTASGNVASTRTITTTAPLSGGGDLSVNRTLSVAITPANDGGAVALQAATPGTAQTGHLNLTGTVKAGALVGPLTGAVTGNVTGDVTGNATTASDGLTSATGTAPLTLGLAAKALTGSISITPANSGGAVALQAATPGSAQTGHLNITGTAKAATFLGNLTGDVTGNLTGNVTGNASGTAANVTGIVATANGGLGANEGAATGFPKFAAGVVTVGPLVSGDIPNNAANTSGTASNVTGTVAIANGGTGQATQTAAFDALAPAVTKGSLYVGNGTHAVAVGVGTDGQALVADSGQAAGVKWASGVTGTVTSVATGNGLSGGPITTAGTIDLNLYASGGLSKGLGVGSAQLGIAPGGVTAAMLDTAYVPTFRTITATAPVRIDAGASADLSANRTISVSDATGIAKGVVQLAGDLGGSAAAPSVATVGGSTAANIATAEAAANAATALNTASTIVKRDGSGNFAAGTITANLTGAVTGNVTGNCSGTAANVTGTVAVANGGTGAANAAGARANLSAAASGANSDITSLAGLVTPLSVPQGGTGASTLTGVLHGNGGAAVTASNVNAATEITGILPIANGGTAASTAWTQGSVFFMGASAFAQDNANLFWDDSNNRLGLGTASPARTLDVNGVIQGRGIAAPAVSSAGNGTLYFDTATNHWMVSENTGAAVPILNATGVSGTGAAKQLAVWTGASGQTGYSGLQWDAATSRLSVNAGASPVHAVDVSGSVNTTAGYFINGNAALNIPTSTTNIVVGTYAGQAITSGTSNTAVGGSSLLTVTTGTDNTAVGRGALRLSAAATSNGTAVGSGAAEYVTTGMRTTALGAAACATVTTGSDNTCIGRAADVSAGAAASRVAIGSGAVSSVDYGVALGDNANALVGIRTATPAATLDVNGQAAFRHADIALVNGANNNVSLTAFSFIRITGPTGAYSISGLTNGVDGRVLYLYNTVGQALTLTNEGVGSTAANRITTLTGADVVLAARTSFATLIYDGAASRWILTSYN